MNMIMCPIFLSIYQANNDNELNEASTNNSQDQVIKFHVKLSMRTHIAVVVVGRCVSLFLHSHHHIRCHKKRFNAAWSNVYYCCFAILFVLSSFFYMWVTYTIYVSSGLLYRVGITTRLNGNIGFKVCQKFNTICIYKMKFM